MVYAGVFVYINTCAFIKVLYCESQHTQLRQCSRTTLEGPAMRGPPFCMALRALCGLSDNSENEKQSL